MNIGILLEHSVMTWISASSWSIVWWHECRHPLGAYRLRHGQQCWHVRSRGVAVLTCRLWRNDAFSCTKNTLGKCWAEFLLRCMTTSTVHACFVTDCGRAGLLSDCINFLLIWDFLAVPFSTFMNLAELNNLVESQVSFFKQLLSQSIWWHSANYSVTNERVFQSPIFTSPILIKFWTGSDTSWNLVLNLCGSMITLVSGLHSSRNFAFYTETLSRLSAAQTMSPSSFLTSAAYVNVFAFSVASLPASSAKYTLLYAHSCHCRQPLQKCQILIQKFSSFQ